MQADSPRQTLRCRILEEETSSLVGLFLFESTCAETYDLPSQQELTNLKRRRFSSNEGKTCKVKQQKFDADSSLKIVRKDVHTALKDLNLMPQIGSDLACSMCPYISKRKGDLKVHYKLKHLGGADLIMTCQICSIQVKTKSYMKKHYMKVHNLTDTAAQNMASSSSA